MSVRLVRTLFVTGLIALIAGIVLRVAISGGWRDAGLVIAIAGCLVALAAAIPLILGEGLRPRGPEPENVDELSDARLRELMRGTSLYLRNMKYRYSVRIDASRSGERRPFAAEVNTIQLGFVPAVITDNTNDRQGYGFVAFVYDGTRWRGPGLPCPADQAEAVRHAARCVSPLAKEEETTIGW